MFSENKTKINQEELVMKQFIVTAAFAFFATVNLSAASIVAPTPTVEQLLLQLKEAKTDVAKGDIVYQLGEPAAREATDELIDIFYNAEHEGLRAMAALSIAKIGDDKGMDVLKKAAYTDDSPYVKKMCGIYYVAEFRGEI
jgi:HEAT repeat protein